ncbi:MAG: hypothetical protein R2828_18620 [Saprospiraceae bacterium]
MKKGLLLSACLMSVLLLDAKTIFVKAGMTGNGTSWTNAFGDLQKALASATNGDQIWVATGTFYTSATADRNASFRLVEGVSLYGGFLGNEADLNQRQPKVNPTILSGEIGTASFEDNAYTVVYAENISQKTVVDGFTITGGASNGYSVNGDVTFSGAAWFNNVASPTINNCIFQNNYAREGAAIYNYANNGICNPIISNCQFIANKADFDGGAIFNMSINSQCTPRIVNCHFENNHSTYGAGILNKGVDGIVKAVITGCIFTNNASILGGGAVYNHREGRGVCDAIMSTCQFVDNTSVDGNSIGNNQTAGTNVQSNGGTVLRTY